VEGLIWHDRFRFRAYRMKFHAYNVRAFFVQLDKYPVIPGNTNRRMPVSGGAPAEWEDRRDLSFARPSTAKANQYLPLPSK
jgi:hypothetical protein